MVKDLNSGKTVKSGRRSLTDRSARRLPEEYNLLKDRLAGFFGTKVQMTCSAQGKGKISIAFTSEEELERLVSLFDKLKG